MPEDYNEPLYYKAPTPEEHADMIGGAIKLIESYAQGADYKAQKIEEIKSIGNTRDNFMVIIAKFDFEKQIQLADLIAPATRQAVYERLLSVKSYLTPYYAQNP